MARRGRPRKPGRRLASGRLAKPTIGEARAQVAAQPHRREFGAEATNPLAGTLLGRSLLRGEIAVEQYDAGERQGNQCRGIAGRVVTAIQSVSATSTSWLRQGPRVQRATRETVQRTRSPT